MNSINLLLRKTSLLGLAIILIVLAACQKEQVLELQAVEVDPKSKIEHHKTIEDYPEVMTLDNMEEFLYAPQEVVAQIIRKQEAAEDRPRVTVSSSVLPANSRALVFGLVQSFSFTADAWLPIGGVNINSSTANCSLSPTVSSNVPGSIINYFTDDACGGPVCMDFPTDVRNGVSTYDVYLLQRHILGIQTLKHAFQYIAGDVNRDGVLSATDVAELRQVILFLKNDFSNSDNMVFVEENDFSMMQDVLDATQTVTPLILATLGQTNPCLSLNELDRRAIKTGDLNSSFVF